MQDDDRGRSLEWVRGAKQLCLIHQDGVILEISEALVRLLGYAHPEELRGKRALDLVHADDRPYIAERIEAIYATQEPTQRALQRLLHKDGRPLFVEVHSVPILVEGHAAAFTKVVTGEG